jgi:hypothetical protein
MQTRVQVPHGKAVFQYHVQIQIGILVGRSVGIRAEQVYLFNRNGVDDEFFLFVQFRPDCFVHSYSVAQFRSKSLKKKKKNSVSRLTK